LTDWNRRDVFDNVVRRLGQPPFTGQPDNSRRVSFWRTQLNEVSQRLTATNAGAAICRGPRNVLAHVYQAVPIGITVEGANILTRSMIIYGQGAIRCHPYLHAEMESAAAGDLARFDRAFFGHVRHALVAGTRALALGLTDGRLAGAPGPRETARLLQRFSRMSAAFATVSELALATLGGGLKRREKISGRLADALAWLYLGSATLKQFHDDGAPARDLPLATAAATHALFEIQQALDGVLANLPARAGAALVRVAVFPLGTRYRPPDDALGASAARGLLENRAARVALTRDIYIPPPDEAGLGRLEAALGDAVAAHAVETTIRDAVREGRLDKAPGDLLVAAAHAAGIITAEQVAQLTEAAAVRDEVIQVDAFEPDAFTALRR
jgi:acyl-CoA dehydrogenase